MQEQYQAIGETAGKIYRGLEKNGTMETALLQKEINVPDSTLFNQALGWLARGMRVQMRNLWGESPLFPMAYSGN